ncbi:restriction endonuclease subunit S [Lentzea rhizosphaerae]|uniref:Restriction endonuclease subunit S n=1 Tax=Lentzea rhizosphaerae TaxID=2041025 RepID=A0ABV8BNF0_9PSEU
MSTATVKLSEVAEINPRVEARPTLDTLVSFLGMADVDAESGTTTRGKERRYAEVAKGYTQFANRDLLVAKITPCFENGKIAQAELDHPHGTGSTEFHVIRPDRAVLDDRFLLRFLRQPYVRIAGERRMTGSAGQRRVPEAYLADLQIPLIPISEQRQIAQILDNVDALRTKRRKAIALLKDLAQSIFLDMFGDPLSNPMGWDRVQLGDLLLRIDSGKSPQCLDRPAEHDEWGVLKLGAVTQCVYRPEENKALPASIEADPRHEVQAGDLLFTRKNTPELVAASAYVRETRERLLLPDLVFRLVPVETAPVNKIYLHSLLTYPPKRRKVQELASGSAASMPNISKSRLLEFKIELPSLELQEKFAARMNALEGAKLRNLAHLAELDSLFASLQDRAFRGELWGAPAA